MRGDSCFSEKKKKEEENKFNSMNTEVLFSSRFKHLVVKFLSLVSKLLTLILIKIGELHNFYDICLFGRGFLKINISKIPYQYI